MNHLNKHGNINHLREKDPTFGMKDLSSLPFEGIAKPIRSEVVNLMDDLEDAAKEVQLHKCGKVSLQTLDEFLDEL